MSKKAERQLKELRRLMPWTWDSRVDEHPPGEKAMQDFEDVLNYKLEERKRRSVKPPSPVSKPSTKSQTARAHLSPDKDPLPLDTSAEDTTNVATQPAAHHPLNINASAEEDTTIILNDVDHISECTPAIGLTKHRSNAINHITIDQKESFVTPAINQYRNNSSNVHGAATPTSLARGSAGAALDHPAVDGRQRPHDSPASRPSTYGPLSEHRPALADGQFQPTPLSGPTSSSTVNGTSVPEKARKGPNHDAFPCPLPRTVFAPKKRKTTEHDLQNCGNSDTIPRMQQTPLVIDGSVPPAMTNAAQAVDISSDPRENNDNNNDSNNASSVDANPPVPKTAFKGTRTPSGRRPWSHPPSISFLSSVDNVSKDASQAGDAEGNGLVTDVFAASLMQSLSSGHAPPRKPTTAAKSRHNRGQHVAAPDAIRRRQPHTAKQQAELDRDARAMVKKYAGRGPKVARPPTCPPLFKSRPSRASTKHVSSLAKKIVAQGNGNGSTAVAQEVQEPLPPTAEKRAQVAALSKGMFAYERSLLACVASRQTAHGGVAGAMNYGSKENTDIDSYVHDGNATIVYPEGQGDVRVLVDSNRGGGGVTGASASSLGLSLAWACNAVKALQQRH